MTFADTSSATFSPELAGGPLPYVGPVGRMIAACGQGRAPASLSARQAAQAGLLTSGTYGHTSTGSSSSANLQSYMENRLQALLALSGSTLYVLTWKARVTPSGARICALRASAPRTSDSGCTGWPTPMAGTPAQNGNNPAGNTDSSRKTVALAGWPTAQARDWKGAPSAGNDLAHNARPLNEVARLAGWGTPTASEPGGTAEQALTRKEGLPCGQSVTALAHQVQLIGPIRFTADGQVLTGSTAGMESGGQLKPEHSRWLMGYLPVWDVCGATAMPSSRKSPKRSSGPRYEPLP
jgi:hypothetical protein